MKKTYEMIGALNFQVQPPDDLRWIPAGYGQFDADLHPKREAFLLRAGIVKIVEKPEKPVSRVESKES